MIDWLHKPSTIVWSLYLAAAELASCLPSYSFSCILVSDENNAKGYSGNQSCATMHEAIFRFSKFIWVHANHDNINAFAAVAVAVFTFTLWRSTLKLWEAGERQIAVAKESANAARAAADAAMRIELPSIELAQFKLLKVTSLKDVNGVPIERGTNLPEFCGLVVNFTNSGRTSAQTFEQCVEWRVCKDLPPVPEYMHQRHFPPGQLLKQGMTTGSLIGNNFQFSADERSAISNGTQFLWVYCYLRYLDFVGASHEKRFCARWLGEHPHFGTPVGFVFDSATPPEYVKSY